MIEIIREENWDDTKEKKLPKDIRQIGRPDVDFSTKNHYYKNNFNS